MLRVVAIQGHDSVGHVCGLSSSMYKGIQQGMSNPNQWAMFHPKQKQTYRGMHVLLDTQVMPLHNPTFIFFKLDTCPRGF
jgi:hypothetical protein